MFDEHQKRPTESSWIGPKILIAAAAAMLLSFGLCGIGIGVHIGNGLGILSRLGFWLFFLSIAAIVIGVIITVVEVIIAISRGK
jgi:hypothetical protein